MDQTTEGDTTMRIPDFWHEEGHAAVKSFGKALRYDPHQDDTEESLKVIEAFASGAAPVLWQRFSADPNHAARFQVAERSRIPYGNGARVYMHTRERFNGIILRERGTVACATRDCPIVVLWSRKEMEGSPVGIFHLSRDTAQDVGRGRPTRSILIHGAQQCLDTWGDPRHVRGVITLGIRAEHFPNERHPEVTEALVRYWGEAVVPDRARHTIDLVALAHAQLASLGIEPTQIIHDGLDTYSDPGLASNRRGHNGYHNLVLVTYR